jgi:hypothetical protein
MLRGLRELVDWAFASITIFGSICFWQTFGAGSLLLGVAGYAAAVLVAFAAYFLFVHVLDLCEARLQGNREDAPDGQVG